MVVFLLFLFLLLNISLRTVLEWIYLISLHAVLFNSWLVIVIFDEYLWKCILIGWNNQMSPGWNKPWASKVMQSITLPGFSILDFYILKSFPNGDPCEFMASDCMIRNVIAPIKRKLVVQTSPNMQIWGDALPFPCRMPAHVIGVYRKSLIWFCRWSSAVRFGKEDEERNDGHAMF